VPLFHWIQLLDILFSENWKSKLEIELGIIDNRYYILMDHISR